MVRPEGLGVLCGSVREVPEREPMESRDVVASFLACWRVQDLELALTHFHDEIVYTLHNGPNAGLFSGSHHGIEGCRQLGYAVLAEFDYLDYVPTIVNVAQSVVQVHVAFRIKHRQTGHVIEGTQRSVFGVRDGRIETVDIFEDAARVETFMTLLAQRMAMGKTHDGASTINGGDARFDSMKSRLASLFPQRAAGRK